MELVTSQIKPLHVKTNAITGAPSLNSDQFGHTHNLIGIIVVRVRKRTSLRPQRTVKIRRSDWMGI